MIYRRLWFCTFIRNDNTQAWSKISGVCLMGSVSLKTHHFTTFRCVHNSVDHTVLVNIKFTQLIESASRNVLVNQSPIMCIQYNRMPVITMAIDLPHEIKVKFQPAISQSKWHLQYLWKEKQMQKDLKNNENRKHFPMSNAATIIIIKLFLILEYFCCYLLIIYLQRKSHHVHL